MLVLLQLVLVLVLGWCNCATRWLVLKRQMMHFGMAARSGVFFLGGVTTGPNVWEFQ
jgi:hypothetical protein